MLAAEVDDPASAHGDEVEQKVVESDLVPMVVLNCKITASGVLSWRVDWGGVTNQYLEDNEFKPRECTLHKLLGSVSDCLKAYLLDFMRW